MVNLAKRFLVERVYLKIREDTHVSDLLRTSGILYVGGLIALILLLIQQFSLARLLGASDYGRLAIIISSGLLVMLFLDFRTWELGIKLITSEITGHSPIEVVRLLNWLVSIEVVTGVVGAIILFVFAEPIATHLLNIPGSDWLIRLYALTLPFRVMADGVISVVPRVYNQFKWVAYKTVSNNMFRLLFMVAFVLLGYGLNGAIVGAVISDVINFTVVVVIAWRILRREAPGVRLLDRTRPRQQSAGYRAIGDYWVVSTLVGLNQQAIIPFMGLLSSTTQVGVFRISLDTAQFIDKLCAPITLGVTPQVMRIYEQEKWGTFRRYVRQTGTLFAIAVTPLTFAIVAFGPFVFPKILQDQSYSSMPLVAGILAIGYALTVAITPWTRPVLIAVGYTRMQSWAMLGQTLLMFALFWWLTPSYGAAGAALAMALPMALFSLFYLGFWIYVSRQQPQPQPV